MIAPCFKNRLDNPKKKTINPAVKTTFNVLKNLALRDKRKIKDITYTKTTSKSTLLTSKKTNDTTTNIDIAIVDN